MRYIGMAITGLLVGIMARFFYPGTVPIGWLWSIGLGLGGSYLAGFLGAAIQGKRGRDEYPRSGFGWSVLGAMLLIFVFRNVLHLV